MTASRSRSTWLLWAVAALIVTALNLTFLVLSSDVPTPPGSGGPLLQTLSALAYLAMAVVGGLILSCHPRHPVGWVCGIGGMGLAVAAFASEYPPYALFASPVPLPAAETVAWVGSWLWWAAFGATVTFLFLLFPDGRLPSRRWRPVAAVATLNLVALAAGHAFTPGLLDGEYAYVINPAGVDAPADLFERLRSAGWGLVTFNLLASVTALATRLARARGEARQQLKWLAYSGSLCAAALPAWALTATDGGSVPVVVQLLEGLAFVAVPVSAGIAILRHRLYDIDIVINKTLVVGALAGFVTAVYAAVVAGIGALVHTRAHVALSIVATAIVATAFQPVRERFQTLANRVVFGQRLTPYEAVTRFSERLSGILSPVDVLPAMAEAAANGVSGTRAEVRLFLPNGEVEKAAWPHAAAGSFDATVPIVHRGATLGEISVGKAAGETLTERDAELLGDLAVQAGPVLRNVSLTRELQASLEELRASRQRIVAAQDQERRRVERDLHDGAQQTLVSTSAKLGLARRLAATDPTRADALLDDVGTGISEAVDQLRDLARGIFPPLLTQRGVAAALEMHLLKAGLGARLDVDGAGTARFPAEVEAALYFCAVEALQNASKHAAGADVSVCLRADAAGAELEVADHGPGFDGRAADGGCGLQNMADRIEAIGGRLEILTAPGAGTVVRARVGAVAGARGRGR